MDQTLHWDQDFHFGFLSGSILRPNASVWGQLCLPPAAGKPEVFHIERFLIQLSGALSFELFACPLTPAIQSTGQLRPLVVEPDQRGAAER
jgi:hypothetical protein